MVRKPSRRCIQQFEQLGAQFEAGPLHSYGGHPQSPPRCVSCTPSFLQIRVVLTSLNADAARSDNNSPSSCRDPRSGAQAVMTSPCSCTGIVVAVARVGCIASNSGSYTRCKFPPI